MKKLTAILLIFACLFSLVACNEAGPQGEKGEQGEQGEKGDPGETPMVGYNGNWWIGNKDTGVKAVAETHVHTFNKTFTLTEATCTKEGYILKICSECSEVVCEVHEALGHNFESGTCTRCVGAGGLQTPWL